MIRRLLNRTAQATASEYVLTIFIVVAVAGAMMMYFRRTIQARIYDARNYMIKDVARTIRDNDLNVTGGLHIEYEPYYVETDSKVRRSSESEQILLPGLSTGIFTKTMDDETIVNAVSVTAPPKDTD